MHLGKVWVILAVIGILMVLIPPIRHVVSHFLISFVSPTIRVILRGMILWIWAFLKSIARHHFVLLRNLLMPRQALFKTLETGGDEDE